MLKKFRLVAAPLILVATIGLFIWYLDRNPAVIEQLKQTSPGVVVAVAILHGAVLVSLMAVLHSSLLLYRKPLGLQENFLLTAYSSLVNFFGPGQSGPGFRAAFLKLRHGLLIRKYVFVTVIYYAWYGAWNLLLVLGASQPWWLSLLAVGCLVVAGMVAWRLGYQRYSHKMEFNSLSKSTIFKVLFGIGLAALVQVAAHCAVYYTELRALDSSIDIAQALAYSGAANLALFVSLTPGAIGIREAFLLFSQNLHQIPSDIIVAANILDRAVYLLFLAALCIVIVSLHAGTKLQVAKVKQLDRNKNL